MRRRRTGVNDRISRAARDMQEAHRREPVKQESPNPDWVDQPRSAAPGLHVIPGPDQFDPEEYTRSILAPDKDNPPMSHSRLMDMIAKGEARVNRGYIYQARQDRRGSILKESEPGRPAFKIKAIRGHQEFLREVDRAKASQRLREDNFGANFNQNLFGPFDRGQYTEYAPLLGGPFFAQQYFQDMLKGFAYAFEAWNHNPLAHRIINALSQYTMGRRFTWTIDDPAKERAWDEFAERINLVQRMSKYWIREKLIFGEQLLDTKKWRTLHPSTVWEIVTDPDDFSDVYYYYRSYPTAYQMFTGMKVPGVPGADKVRATDYVVEQVPFSQIIHSKANCTSFEKRGRSTLFPILGWLKRIKDIYNNQAIREQMLSDYVWDVTIKGGPGDVAKYAQQYQNLARPGSTHFHNEAVERKPMAVPAGSHQGSEASNNILAFIATAIGLPKDFFNLIAQSGGNRATALVAAEPFTKVIEDEQADQEFVLHQMAKKVFEDAGLTYSYDDIEFTFPSVTKDTTSETVKNIIIGETQGYISKERAATLYTQEMNITAYDFDSEQGDIKNEVASGNSNLMQPGMPDGRMGDGGVVKDSPDVPAVQVPDQKPGAGAVGDSPNHGTGKQQVKKDMGRL